MSTLPRALRRARLWTAGLMSAATFAVGAMGLHLADAHTQAVATQTTAQTSSDSSGPSVSSSSSGSSDSSGSSGSSADSSFGSGFGAVAPVNGSNAQAQTNSGGS